MKIVLVTGGFDPLHSGHISYFKEASTLGDMLIVGLNSDEWLERKKGKAFMPWNERLCILNNLTMVDEVYTFDDSDDSARHFIQQVRAHYPDATLIFANGGDRRPDNIPEMDMIDNNLIFKFGVGGTDKKNSSSWILNEWKSPKIKRPWGFYRVLYTISGTKVKEITIDPGKSLSLQRHFKRNEFWFVTQGACDVFSTLENGYHMPIVMLKEHLHHFVPKKEWHQLRNPFEIPCKIIEIQYGDDCVEEDIERK
jgi:cytidyltransferase-like protein